MDNSNRLTAIAQSNGRDCITPDDVIEAIVTHRREKNIGESLRLDLVNSTLPVHNPELCARLVQIEDHRY